MKYIIVEVGPKSLRRKLPIMFAQALVHKDMFDMLKGKDSTTTIISAGFIDSIEIGAECHGKSISLNVKSRGTVDTALIQMHDYFHGLEF